MAEAIDDIRHKLQEELKEGEKGSLDAVLFRVLRAEIKATKTIRFEGDGYSHEWLVEAQQRGLKNVTNSFDALQALLDNADVFCKYQVLNAEEVRAIYNVSAEQFVSGVEIEVRTLIQMVDSAIVPVLFAHQRLLAESLISTHRALSIPEAEQESPLLRPQKQALSLFSSLLSKLLEESHTLKQLYQKEIEMEAFEEKGRTCVANIQPQMLKVRAVADQLEQLVPTNLWPFSTYTDILSPGSN